MPQYACLCATSNWRLPVSRKMKEIQGCACAARYIHFLQHASTSHTLTDSFKRVRCCRSRALLFAIAALPRSAKLFEALMDGEGPSRLALPPRTAGMLSVLPGGRDGNAPTTFGLQKQQHSHVCTAYVSMISMLSSHSLLQLHRFNKGRSISRAVA